MHENEIERKVSSITYQILTTGSKGNAILIDNILIDAGLTTKKLKTLVSFDDIEHVFVSHKHSDHFDKPLIRAFITNGTQVYLPEGVREKLDEEGKLDWREYDNVHAIPDNCEFECGDYHVTAVPQKHWDIVNYAYVLTKGDERYLYSTDLDTLEPSDLGEGLYGLGKFDVIFLEGNYDEEWLREYIVSGVSLLDDGFDFETLTSDELNKWVRKNYTLIPRDMAGGLFRAVQNMRHLSKQQARAYVRDHLKPGGKYYEIHRSSMFYERPSDWEAPLGEDW